MEAPEHPFVSLEYLLQKTLQRIKPPPRFVRVLGRKIQVLPPRPVANRANGSAFLLLILAGALFMGAVSVLLTRLLRRKPHLP